MRANESIENYDIKVREYANYAIKSIKNVVKQFGPRPVGSQAETDAQAYMKADLDKFCDETAREEFQVSDKAFMAWVPLGAALLILSAAFYTLGWAVVGLALTVLALFFIVGEFVLYKPVLDGFFPKKTSGNVVGVRKAAGETKRRIIVSGHTDSAFEWTYTYKGGRTAVAGIIGTAVAAILLSLGGNIYLMIHAKAALGGIVWGDAGNLALRIIAVLLYLCVPVLIAAFRFCNFKRPVPGANDDLTGVFISCAVAKFLSDNDIRFENTEVVTLCSGGEEAGLRGAKAYAKAHAAEFKAEKDVQTVFVGFDTICELDYAMIYDKDMTGVVKNDRRVAELLQTAAKNVGLEVPIGAIPLGSTDAAAMSQAGLATASIVAMDPTPARYYHTRLDDLDKLSPQAIDAGVKIALETVFLFDEKGI